MNELSNKSPAERLMHATAFELIAIAFCAPVAAWVMGTPLAQMGALTFAFSLIAMAWNMAFNAGFDRLQRHLRFRRSLPVRVAHAVVFETVLVAICVPIAAWWLSIGLVEAFLLDAALLLFFLPYTVVFNWVYDLLRDRRVAPSSS